MLAGGHGSLYLMNTQRRETTSGGANKTPCSEFLTQIHPPVFPQKHRDTIEETNILLYREKGSVTKHKAKKNFQISCLENVSVKFWVDTSNFINKEGKKNVSYNKQFCQTTHSS